MSDNKIEWKISEGLIEYPDALAFMEQRVQDIHMGRADELVWFLQHPSLYTAGTSAKDDELLDSLDFPVHKVGRGGRFTYHGPGQLVVYVMLDLKQRQKDIHAYIKTLEQWIIDCLSEYGIKAERREGRIGLWVTTNGREEKIAAIGVRVTKWITWHGFSINVHPNLDHFKGIIPCGLSKFGVTSMQKLGVSCSVLDVAQNLQNKCKSCLDTPLK